MFSFEGHYRKPRSINYGKQKDVGKKDLIENARSEREKRALLSRQILCATKIQKAYRHYLLKQRNKKEAYNEFRQIISNISHAHVNPVQFNELVVRCIDFLLVYFNSCNNSDDSLKLIVNLLIVNDNVANLFAHAPPQSCYYYATSLGLLLRLTAKHLHWFSDNAPSVSYNIFVRLLEIFFLHLSPCDGQSQPLRVLHQRIVHSLLESRYFYHISEFVAKQLLWRTESATEVYHQIKANSVLRIVLSPLEIAKNHDLLGLALVEFVNNIYSDHGADRLKLFQLMNIAILDIVSLDNLIAVIYQHRGRLRVSTELLFLILSSVVATTTHNNDSHCLSRETAAKSLLLFFHLSRPLLDDNQLILSNNVPSQSSTITTSRDDFDFEMHEEEAEKPSGYELSDSDGDSSSVSSSSSELSSSERQRRQRHRNNAVVKEMSPIEREIAMILKSQFCQLVVPLAIDIDDDGEELYDALGHLYHLLILDTKLIGNSESKSFILNLIQTSKSVSRRLWRSVADQKAPDSKSVMQSLIGGQLLSLSRSVVDSDVKQFFGKLLCFANCLHWRLLSVQDLDLVDTCRMEFSPDELCDIVLKLRDIMYGLVLLIYDSKSCITSGVNSSRSSSSRTCAGNEKLVKVFIELQRVVTRLYNRDVRKGLRGLSTGKRLDWVKPDICRAMAPISPAGSQLLLDHYRLGAPIGTSAVSPVEQRQIVVLKEMPFIVPIGTRMKLFQQLLSRSTPATNATTTVAATVVRVRRDYLYEDAFNQIVIGTGAANLRTTPLKIEFIDRFGMLEPGVDGGGLLREFLGAIIKEACDPKRGLFVSTSNNLLYPNPELETLYPDNWRAHLIFFGRMLGLMIVRGLLVEAPFAPFFIQKLVGCGSNRRSSRFRSRESIIDIDIDNLQYLDEDLYRNLLSLKSMPAVEEINLDFSLSRSCYGVSTVVELKPRGAQIAVTNANKIEYIYLVADYKLNRQIAPQTAAIVAGLGDVLPVHCFRLFDLDEIAFIIAGSSGGTGAAIDLSDLRRNTVYHGVDDPERSPVIRNFWTVLFELSEEEKRNFIQFVTSISRPPMLGFGELSPKFGIQIVPDTDRLPTASTCINLLKLPAYEEIEEMRQKLLYAIGSDSGFHLS